MPIVLTSVEARVLGCLIEKDMTTPEYYPLTLNALVNACNQKSNREPVVHYDDATAREGLRGLRDLGLVMFVSEAGSRVDKFRHRMSDSFNLSSGELALLTVLLLRGPQTSGELRTRTERMHAFEDLESVDRQLERMARHEPDPLAMLLPRQPGQKEQRWVHLLSGEPQIQVAEGQEIPAFVSRGDRLAQIEQEFASLKEEVAELRSELRMMHDKLRDLLE